MVLRPNEYSQSAQSSEANDTSSKSRSPDASVDECFAKVDPTRDQEALKQYPLLADDTGLVEKNNAFFGSLIIRYKNE